ASSALVERGPGSRRRCIDLDRREAGGLLLALAAYRRVVDHVTAEDDDVSGLASLFRPAADERAQLLLSPADHGGGFGDDLAVEFELAKEIELLLRGVERKPIAVCYRERRRLGIVFDRVFLAFFDQREFGAGGDRPVMVLIASLDRHAGGPSDAPGHQRERKPAFSSGHVLP